MDHDAALAATLLDLAPVLARARHPWWIIAGAAVRLHGAADQTIGDVDLLIDPQDVTAVFAALGLPILAGVADERFRSAWFGRWEGAALPVEVFAGFELCEAGQWQPVRPASRIALACGRVQAFVPDAAELAEILRRFGRPKDLARAALLSSSGPSPSRSGNA
jgi:hypothetical protein